jgi:hypothetical protein
VEEWRRISLRVLPSCAVDNRREAQVVSPLLATSSRLEAVKHISICRFSRWMIDIYRVRPDASASHTVHMNLATVRSRQTPAAVPVIPDPMGGLRKTFSDRTLGIDLVPMLSSNIHPSQS